MKGWRDLGHHAAAFILRGKGRYRDECGNDLPVGPGTLIIVFPGLKHYYQPDPGTEWTEFYLIFGGPVIDLWEQQGLLTRDHPVVTCLLPPEVWAKRFEGILGPSGSLATDPPMIEVCRLQMVLAEMIVNSSGMQDRDDDIIWSRRARSLLEVGVHRHASIQEIAAQFGLSPHAFSRKFSRLTGLAPSHYRTVRMIDRACELMQVTSLLDKEIADNLGFCDEFYFSRRFKEITGKSPRKFRNELHGMTSSEPEPAGR
ncbi:MAG: AraC family transcriptional regulator [Akkermansiaceae bacterium]|nr:AraC family transcriptional regulator [Akkermansiaceae bacterium]